MCLPPEMDLTLYLVDFSKKGDVGLLHDLPQFHGNFDPDLRRPLATRRSVCSQWLHINSMLWGLFHNQTSIICQSVCFCYACQPLAMTTLLIIVVPLEPVEEEPWFQTLRNIGEQHQSPKANTYNPPPCTSVGCWAGAVSFCNTIFTIFRR